MSETTSATLQVVGKLLGNANDTIYTLSAQVAALTEQRDAAVKACRAATELTRLQAILNACEDPDGIQRAQAWIDAIEAQLAAAIAMTEAKE